MDMAIPQALPIAVEDDHDEEPCADYDSDHSSDATSQQDKVGAVL